MKSNRHLQIPVHRTGLVDPVFFFDDGGVLNDNRRRGPEWKRLIAAFFIPRYGGTSEEWSRANELALQGYIRRRQELEQRSEMVDRAQLDRLDTHWVEDMFHSVGIPLPAASERFDCARQAVTWIIPQVRSAFPGIAEVICSLSARGYVLHTASAEQEYELEGYLRGMGVREHFDQLFGVDKLGVFKTSPLYFTTILERLGIDPPVAVFIEDRPSTIAMIESVGAVAIQSRLTGEYQPVTQYHFDHPTELLAVIDEILQKLPQS